MPCTLSVFTELAAAAGRALHSHTAAASASTSNAGPAPPLTLPCVFKTAPYHPDFGTQKRTCTEYPGGRCR